MINEFFTYLQQQGKSDLTIRQYKSTWNRYKTFIDEEKTLLHGKGVDDSHYIRESTTLDIADFRRWMEKATDKRKAYSPNTVIQALNQLNAIFRYYHKQKKILDNPVEHTNTKVTVQLAAPKWLDHHQSNALVRAAREKYNNAVANKGKPSQIQALRELTIIQVLLFTGLRVQELCNLKHEDLTIRERSGWVIVRGKGNKVRKIPLNADVRKALNNYYAEHTPKGEYVFDSQRSEKMTSRAVQLILNKYAEAVKIPGLTPHTLRHTFIHNLMTKEGLKENVVAQIAGHMKADGTPNTAMTYRYSMPDENELQAAVESISWLNQSN